MKQELPGNVSLLNGIEEAGLVIIGISFDGTVSAGRDVATGITELKLSTSTKILSYCHCCVVFIVWVNSYYQILLGDLP